MTQPLDESLELQDHQMDRERQKGRRRRWLLASIVMALLLAVGGLLVLNASTGGGTDGKADDETEEEKKVPVPVEVREVVLGSVSSYVTATANLVPENEVEVLAEIDGRLSQVLAEEGDRVAAAQALAVLAREDSEIALTKAQLREANARLAHERAQELHRQQLVSEQELDKLKTEYQIARQELAEARWRLEKTTIRAPFAGRVTERFARPGQHVRAGEQLFRLADFDPLVARIYLPEKDVLAFREGQEAVIHLNADPGVRFRGRIRQVSPVVDPGTGTVKVTVEAMSPPREVRPGSFVTVSVVRESRRQVPMIPREAVLQELGKSHIFVAKGEVAEKRSVVLGLEENGWVEARSGVELGEQVIVAGQGGLKAGSLIRILADETSETEG